MVRFLFTLLLLGSNSLYANEVVLTSMNYPPFYGEKMENKGPLIEIIVRALESQGYKTRILFSPWKRAMLYAKEGKVADGMVGVWYNDDRAEDFIYSAPHISKSIRLL